MRRALFCLLMLALVAVSYLSRYSASAGGLVLDRWTGTVWQCDPRGNCAAIFPPRTVTP